MPLWISCPKVSIYKRGFYKTRCICFSIKDETLLENYNKVWEKFSNII